MHPPRIRYLLPTLLLSFGLVACSDDGTDADDVALDIQGRWVLSADLTQEGGDLACQISNLSMEIEQQGSTQLFGGATAGGTLTCSRAGETESRAIEALQISSGRQAEGTEIRFNLVEDPSTTFLQFDGRFSSAAMTGDVAGLLLVNLLGQSETSLAMTGTFNADRVVE